MEEIKVNEYVRTIAGNIDKVDALYGMIENTIHLEKHKWQDMKNIVKHSPNIIDLIEDEDTVILEYKSPKYRERITRRFEVSKIDNDIRFENAHCNFHCKVGDKKITDKICKNIQIKGIATIENFESIKYEV